MPFKTDIITKRDMTKDFCWVLTEPLVYENDNYTITVLKDFDFDYASIPWLFRRMLPKNGMKYDRASCLHDAMYASQIFRKEECDSIFLEAMNEDHVDSLIANAMHFAVHIGGKSAYEECEEIAKYRDLIKVEVKNA